MNIQYYWYPRYSNFAHIDFKQQSSFLHALSVYIENSHCDWEHDGKMLCDGRFWNYGPLNVVPFFWTTWYILSDQWQHKSLCILSRSHVCCKIMSAKICIYKLVTPPNLYFPISIVQALTYQWSFQVLLLRNFELLFLLIQVQIICSTVHLMHFLVQSHSECRSFLHCLRHSVVLLGHPQILKTKILLSMLAKI